MRLQPVRGIAHDLQIEIMYARLIEHDVREFREPVFDILNPAVPDDCLSANVVRPPKRCLVDPIGLLSTRSLKPKASNISMVRQAMPSAWPSSSGPDFCSTIRVLISGKAASCAARVKSGRPAPDDQDVNVRGKSGRVGRGLVRLGRIREFWIAGSEAVEMELHGATFPARVLKNFQTRRAGLAAVGSH